MAITTVTNIADIQGLVDQLMTLERQPLNKIEARKSVFEQQKTAWDDINSKLKALELSLQKLAMGSTFQSKLVTSSDSTVADATATVTAPETSYTFSNITLAQATSATTSGTLGLSAGTAYSITSGEDINVTGSQAVDPNQTIASGLMNIDSDKTIVSGSFAINGVTINVTASDTINTILSKINSAGIDLTATFSGDKITIAHDKIGYFWDVEFGSDNTGFLEAMKLTSDGGNPAPTIAEAVNPDWQRSLSDVMVTGTNLQSGYFNINNITIGITVGADSLQIVINKINNSEAGVLAYYDEVSDKITLSSKETGEDITITNDTANFFETIGISTGTHTGTGAQFDLNGQTLTRDSNSFTLNGTTFTLRSAGTTTITVENDTEKATTAVSDFVDKYNDLNAELEDKSSKLGPLYRDRRVSLIHNRIKRMISTIQDSPGGHKYISEVGITFSSFGSDARLSFDRTEFNDALKESTSKVFKFFAYDSDGDLAYDDGGLAVGLEDFVDDFTRGYSSHVSSYKRLIDSRITQLDRQIERWENRLERKEQMLYQQYQQMSDIINRLSSQANYVLSGAFNLDN
jgi:flagellar hook-associated protein 2